MNQDLKSVKGRAFNVISIVKILSCAPRRHTTPVAVGREVGNLSRNCLENGIIPQRIGAEPTGLEPAKIGFRDFARCDTFRSGMREADALRRPGKARKDARK